jgi:ligand-binding sensor domain-containing protein/DNA-binding CsgD family transcriptional regulator
MVIIPFHHLKYIILIIFASLITRTEVSCQKNNIGTPPIINYSKKEYNAATQNWDISQDDKGIMYFANNGGLLIFDGVRWQCIGVSNQTLVRSVKAGKDGKIFVGAQGELGYFKPSNQGLLIYTSLKNSLPKEQQKFADVWDIEIHNEQVFFRTDKDIFRYSNDQKLDLIHSGISLKYLKKVGNNLYLHDAEKGLFLLEDDKFVLYNNQSLFLDQDLSGIYQLDNNQLLITLVKGGLFQLDADSTLSSWEINDNNSLQSSSIYCSTQIDENTFAFGTSTKGVFIVNKQGKVIQHINNKSGLQKNNVISLFSDQSKNLWLGLNNGIDYIETSSPFTSIFPDDDLAGTGYAINIYNDRIYFGTSNGAYSRPWQDYYNPTNNTPYQLVTNSNGQVWDLLSFNNELLLNHHEGIFRIQGNTAQKITDKKGAWFQIPLEDKNILLAGFYSGLGLMEWNGKWQFSKDFETDWKESCRVMAQDDLGNIWVSHPYRGVFKVKLADDYSKLENIKRYGSQDGFPSDLLIYVFKIGDEVVFCAEKGVYSYNSKTDKFEPNDKWNNTLGDNIHTRRLIEAPNGDIWFVTDEGVGVLEISDGGVYKNITKKNFPKLKDKLVGGFETIYQYDKDNIFIALESGFIHFNSNNITTDTIFQTIIRSVELETNNQLLFGGFSTPENSEVLSVASHHNAISFNYSATYYQDISSIEYQFYLDGFEDDWQTWTDKTEKEYTNLNPDTYTFKVRSRNINGNVSETTSYQFTISPPWYATKFAYSAYFLMLTALLFSLILIPKKQFEKEKAQLQQEQEITLKEKEQEYKIIEQQQQAQISQLEREKLQSKIQFKNQELASTTMHLVKKSEMLQKIQEELRKISKSTTDTNTAKSVRKVIRILTADEELSNDWQQFEQYFDQVHSNFLQRLREEYPKLTPKDYRLCAYLRMNLSTKEIAPLMNISVRGVEIARYRLRKKLELDKQDNLIEFMMKV